MHEEDGIDRRNWGFSGAHSAQIIRPPPALKQMGCRLAPETIPITGNCAVPQSQAPLEITHFFAVLWGLENPLCRNSEIFHQCTHAHMASSLLLFQKWLKSVQNKWPKGSVGFVAEKKQNTFWHP